MPANIALLHLPPYAPELNPMENVWEYLRSNKLCNLVWNTDDAIVEARRLAWNFLIGILTASDQPGRVNGHVSMFRAVITRSRV